MAHPGKGSNMHLSLILLIYLSEINGNFINFQTGFEYEYKVDSRSSIKGTGNIHIKAKVGYINVNDNREDGQEVFIRVHNFIISRDSSNPVGHDADFSKWFSFLITREGEIKSVFYSRNEDGEILALKKGMAAMFASKLRHEDGKTTKRTLSGWQYHVQELGQEGQHDATYVVQPHPDGKMFTKTREKHPLTHATSIHTKTMIYNQDLGNIHTVHINDEFSAMRQSVPGYDPFEGQRPVKPINDFSDLEYPEMSGFGTGKIEFFIKHKLRNVPNRKGLDVVTGSIHVHKIKRQPRRSSTPEVVLKEIKGNLTILRQQPENTASQGALGCFHQLKIAIELLGDSEFTKMSDYYLKLKPYSWNREKDRNHILDAIAATGTDRAQTVLTEKILLNPDPEKNLVLRLLVHIISMDDVPNQKMFSTLLQLAFKPEKSPAVLRSGKVYHRILLTMGSIVRKLNQCGRHEEAVNIIAKIENMLGYHDPYTFRKKRSLMTESEILTDDTWRVNLLCALGNGRMDQSYEFIISHINTSNSHWIKRAGIHALRGYNHHQAASMMLERAMYDDNAVVRYEALIQYQSHPKAKLITPYRNLNSSSNSSVYYNPWDLRSPSLIRQKRGVKVYDDFLGDGLGFALESPPIDWKQILGIPELGASFGVVMKNLLELKIALLSGKAVVDVHDEAFARVHLGIIGMNLDFFVARVCLKGSMKYEINILKDFGIDNIKDIVKIYDSVKNDIILNIKEVIDLFKGIIRGDISMETIFNNFKKSLEELPDKVLDLGKKALETMRKLGEIDIEDLPPFIVPVKKFINKVVTLYNDIKKDVMGFYNMLFETVTVIIPGAGKKIYAGIVDVIDAFKHFQNDPQTALENIGKGVLQVGLEVQRLIGAIKKIKEASFFLKGDKPYWFDLKEQFNILKELKKSTKKALLSGGRKWLQQKINRGKDEVAEFTNGELTTVGLKQKVVNELKEVLEELLSPRKGIQSLGGKVLNTFLKVFDLFTKVKNGYNKLKEGYKKASELISRLFGAKCHKKFPNKYRTSGGKCSGSGTYPSRLGTGREYNVDGVDVLIKRGQSVVAPFPGYIRLSPNSSTEIILRVRGGSLKDTEVIITNVRPNGVIRTEERLVQAGSKIGIATRSVCHKKYDHIHFAMRRTDAGGIISPEKYLPKRPIVYPAWVQECDDYLLVWKADVVDAGPIIGRKGESKKEEEPKRTELNVDLQSFSSFFDTQSQTQGVDEHAYGDFSSLKNRQKRSVDIRKKVKGGLKLLLNQPAEFLKKYSIRKLKLGAIINLLDTLKLDKSKTSLAQVMLRIKEIIDNKPCFNPHYMTDDQLRNELTERGKSSSGPRQDMIERLTATKSTCPTLTLDLPKNIFCIFDEHCLGLECCISFKVFVFLKTYKIYARFEPCTSTFVVGVKGFLEEKFDDLKDMYGGFEKDFKPGVTLELLGKMELIIRCKVEKSETAMLASISVGLCSVRDTDNCLLFVPILDEAIIPVPICNVDRSITIPKVDYRDLLDRENRKKKFKESVKKIEEKARDIGVRNVVELLGIPEDLLVETPPCPRPDKLTDLMLQQRLEERGLSLNGTTTDLRDRVMRAEQACQILNQNIAIPRIENETLNRLVYLQISEDCLHLQACLDVELRTQSINLTKSFKAYVKLDPCNYKLDVGFEKISRTILLIDYDWGKEELIPIGDAIKLKFSIDNDDQEKVFVVNLSVTISINGELIFGGGKLIDGMKIPIPICSNNFTLPGRGSIGDLAKAMDGKITSGAVDIIFRKLGLDKIFSDKCQGRKDKTDDCPWSIEVEKYLPADLQDKVTCSMAENCFGLHCCVDFQFRIPYVDKPVNKSVLVFLEFDPCSFDIEVGFGTFRHTERLLTYDWGKPSTLVIGNGDPAPITISYTISKYSLGFIIDVNILACIPVGGIKFCFTEDGFDLMKGARIPACDSRHLVNTTNIDFSLDSWKEQMGLGIGQELAASAVSLLLDNLGITEYLLDKQCDIKRTPYSSNINGWRNDCPKPINKLPKLPEGLVCHLGETCTEINCCFHVQFLNMSFHASLNIDMCDYFVEASIENEVVKYSLLADGTDLDAGISGDVSISNLFRVQYGLRKMDKKFLIDLTIKVCFDDEKCQLELPVMVGTTVPQFICDLDAKDFSLSEWTLSRGIDLNNHLTKQTVRFLLEQLSIADKMSKPPCSRDSLKYQPADQNNWKNDCPKIKNLPAITVPANCYIPDYCTGIDCCLHNDLVDLSVNAYLHIDTCNYIISGGIEKFKFESSIFDYHWGTKKEEKLTDIIVITYKIERLVDDKIFVVDMNIKMCLQGPNDCELDLPLFNQTKIPMPLCNMDSGFKIKDFSLKTWLAENGGDITAILANQLMDYLGITDYLNDDQCNFITEPFKSAIQSNGWKNECRWNITLPRLPDNIGCYIPDYCTGVICCTNIHQIRRTFQTYLLLDNCNYQMGVGIEKRNFNITLIDYEWGKEEVVDIGGIFKMVFTIHNLKAEKQFIVNIKLSACFTAGDDCAVEIPLMKDARIPKILCKWNTDLTEFSLNKFLESEKKKVGDVLSDLTFSKMFEVLGIARYLLRPKCDRQGDTYNPVNSNGWKSNCPVGNVTFGKLPNSVSCRIPAFCTGIDCCIDVPIIGYSFNIKFYLSACDLTLMVSIENLVYKQSLLHYTWGKREQFNINGIVGIEYVIDNLEGAKKYVISLKTTFCFDINTPCLKIPILQNARMTKLLCDWEGTTNLDFSLSTWLSENGLHDAIQLSSVLLSKMFEELGIFAYLKENQCSTDTGIYIGAVDGWKSDLKNVDNLPALPDDVTCYLPNNTRGVQCCVHVSLLRRSFEAFVFIDMCNYSLRVGIEQYQFNRSLINYQWGKLERFTLRGVIKADFSIDDLKSEKMYLVNLNLSICLEAHGACVISLPVLSNTRIPKALCDWDSTFALQDFSLSKWLAEQNQISLRKLTPIVRDKLFEQLEISRYLKPSQCDVITDNSTDGTGWSYDCPFHRKGKGPRLPDLSENMACHIGTRCTSIDCCIGVDFLDRSFNIGIDVNICEYTLIVYIENIRYTRQLYDFSWGEVQSFYLKGVIRVDYILSEIKDEKMLEISVNMSVCLEKDNCLIDKEILSKKRFPQSLCNFKQSLLNSKFSLRDWKLQNRIPSYGPLNEVMLSKLLERLNISSYLKEPECSTDDPLYTPANIKHWRKECSSNSNVPVLPANTACYWSTNCSTIDCCFYVNIIKRSVDIRLNVDICNLEMTFTIERLSYTLSLFDYKWGTVGVFHLKGRLQMRYRLENKATDKQILLDLSLRVCFENNECVIDLPVLQQAIIPYSPCASDQSIQFKGVTFDVWSLKSCKLQLDNPGCPISLPEPVSDICRLNEDCLGITCCVQADNKYFRSYQLTVSFNIHICENKISYSVETKEWEKTLNTLPLNTNITENIGDAISLSYKIGETEGIYVVSLHIKVCVTYKSTSICRYWDILDEKSFIKPTCSTRKRRSVIQQTIENDFKTGLKILLEQDASNDEIQTYIDELAEEEAMSVQRNLEPDWQDGGQVNNMRSALKSMGSSNPVTLVYSNDDRYVDDEVEGGNEVMRMLGIEPDKVNKVEQMFMVGKGLTGKGVELLGVKLANMTIGEVMALIDTKNIDPEIAVKLINDLRNLALDLYSDIIDKVLSGEIANVFQSKEFNLEGDFSFPRQSLTLFEPPPISFPLAGIVTVEFQFSLGCTYGMKVTLGAKIMKMAVYGDAVPYGSLLATLELRVVLLRVFHITLRLEGYILTTSFPTRAEIGFSKFPLDVKMTMDVELIPLKLKLKALVLLKIDLWLFKIEIVLFKKTLWKYSTPSIRTRFIDFEKKEEDETPPTFSEYTDKKSARRKRAIGEPINTSTRHCSVRQLPDRDYTEPAVEISVRSEDDKSQVRLFVTAGTEPGLDDALSNIQIGGQSHIITTILKEDGIPIYFTVVGKNSADASSTVTCSISTYDVTLPGGRFEPDFLTSSNPRVLKASIVVYEDSELVYSAVGVGLGRGIYGDEIVPWTPINLRNQETQHYNPSTDPRGEIAATHFTSSKHGRLVAPIAETGSLILLKDCLKKCLELPPSTCLSVNFDFGPSGQCELLKAIEGHDYKLAVSGRYSHYERLGIGLAHEFIYKDKYLVHDHVYYFNMDLKNVLGYRNIISTPGILIDITPPVPGEGLMNNSTRDDLERIPCLELIPSDRPEWNIRCIDQPDFVNNHRTIIDGPGSRTIFNGHEPQVDKKYFRANRIITANWDGIHDKESGLLGYSFTAGRDICEESIHPHHDPHSHIFDMSGWTHTGLIQRSEDNPLSDGKYYVTVRALNKVDYGGPLATTICHSTEYVIDNSKPFVHEVYNVEYDEETKDLSVEYNATDPESGINEVDICLGRTTKDCYISDWQRYPHSGQIIHNTSLPGGVPVWTKIKAWNNVELDAIKSSDHPLIIDITPPVAGKVFDGPIYKHDLTYTKYDHQICVNWVDFYDPESGIEHFTLFVRSNNTDEYLTQGAEYDHRTHSACADLTNNLLIHGKAYYVEVWAFNAGHLQLNTSARSDGVIVDVTDPIKGYVIDGLSDDFTDLKYSSAMATVSTQWRNYSDPQSAIKSYEIKMSRNNSGEIETLREWHKLDNSIEFVEYHNFHLKHGDQVKSKLRVTNGALGQILDETDGYVVDLTPPRLVYLNDGDQPDVDIEYQHDNTVIHANYKFVDEESGIEYYKYQVYKTEEGSKLQIFPGAGGKWAIIKDTSATNLTLENQQLKSGVRYSVRFVAVNGAGSVSTYDTNGFLIDQTKPEMSSVYVGIFSGEEEDVHDGYVYQADKTGIKATWFAVDDVSGIKEYLVSVRTSPGGNDTENWRSFGRERDGYIDGLQLEETKDNSSVYYVSVKALDGAGLESDVVTSRPIIVVGEDVTGIVYDGPEGTAMSNVSDVDWDYQRKTGTVTVQFSGFESALHGLSQFDWAIGTSAGEEDVQPFLTAGLIHEDKLDVSGNGIASSGYGQAIVSLEPGSTYYTTVRGITNNGRILESTSDGFTVDITPPLITINSVANVKYKKKGDNIYQSEVDSIDITWNIDDPESGIYNMYYTVGTYPHGTDVKPITPIQQLLTGNGSLPVGQVKPNTDGKANIVTIWGENRVGLKGNSRSANLIVDTTPPTDGRVLCPQFIQPHTSMKCTWDGFRDEESPLVEFTFGLGSEEGLTDIIKPLTLSGQTKSIITELPKNVSHGHKYYALVTAKNSVGYSISAVSNGITVDVTPPLEGRVVELNTTYIINVTSDRATRFLNPYSCNTIEECESIDAVCQESMSSINIAWSPFIDPESNIIQYEVAVGTSPGRGDIKPYFTVALRKRYLTIKNLMLKGLRKVYVSVKATNDAGLSTVSVSNGIHMSYVSQGLEPLSHIGVWDGDNEHGDSDYQTNLNSIHCQWDVSGDPCPVVKYEWAIERIDGMTVQNFTDTGGTKGENDQLKMENGERYYCLLRVRNAGGFTYIIRSNGVTIEEQPLFPGSVNDGDIVGYDLNYIYTNNKISANWYGFGELRLEVGDEAQVESGNLGVFESPKAKENQAIEYYEVAVGKDRRFPKTRDNVIPFTNVGLNTSVTFYDLDLVVLRATYYFTVRAYSKSLSMAEVTSNGFKVGYNGGITGGVIDMPEYIKNNTVVQVSWDGFTSGVGMFLYYLAVATHNDSSDVDCKHLVEGRSMVNEDRVKLFDIKDMMNVGKDTFIELTNITIQQDKEYYAIVIGVDNAGYCKMISHKFHVDITPPSSGKIKVGPYYDMKMSYVSTNEFLRVDWMNFTDEESGIRCYRISLIEETSCHVGSTSVVIVPSIEIDSSYTLYNFMDLDLKPNRPYIIKLEVENMAGLIIQEETPPVLYDISVPSAGHVVDGFNYTNDVVWSKSTSTVTGSILHLPSSDGASCPTRKIPFSSPEWMHYVSGNNYDSSGTKLSLKYREANVYIDKEGEGDLEIKIAKDDKTENMFSGAYYRNADIKNGGTYEFKLRAADGDGRAVTSIIFWDGPISQIVDFDYTKERDWTKDVCSCCKINQTDPECIKTCNCTRFLASRNLVKRSTNRSNPDDSSWSVQELSEEDRVTLVSNNSTDDTTADSSDVIIEPHRSCGIQIMAGDLQKVVTWCQYKDEIERPMKAERKLTFDPSTSFNNYKIKFFVQNEDALNGLWCLYVYVNDEGVSELCGVPQLSTDSKIFFHVRNWKNYLPPKPTENQDQFSVWTARAMFKDLVLPPDIHALCRYGDPFRGGTNAIVRYEAGVGYMNNKQLVVPFQEVLAPCIPCQAPCDRYICQSNCSSHHFTQYNISLESLDLPPTEMENGTVKPISYFLTVKAVLGSGQEAISSSNGFYIDVTPPLFIEDVMLYIDVDQGNFTPVLYQGSNSTIKSIWSCEDNESMIVEYQWGIGRSPGSLDIQNFTSVGVNQSGTNDDLLGILEDNSTYYVTVKCINGAGRETIYEDRKGVICLLYPPNIEDVGTNLTGVESFDPSVSPATATKTTEGGAIGFTWTVSADPSIREYDICVGSSESVCDDILPCTWVGYNISGQVTIMDGWLFIDGQKYRPVGASRPALNASATENTTSNFKMEPGRTMFMCMRMCNEAKRCTMRFVGSPIVMNNNSKMATSNDGESVKTSLGQSGSGRRKRDIDDISLETPSDMIPGQSVVITELDERQLTQYYTSDASPDFISFITNPVDTINTRNNLHRLLVNRVTLKSNDKHFVVTSVGQLRIPGPLMFTIKYNPLNTDVNQIPSLLHWNPVQQKWMLSSRSCTMENDTLVVDETIGKITIKVCDTRNKDNEHPGIDVYFSKDTQFMVTDILKYIPNTAPKLVSTTDITMAEDSGTLIYNTNVFDEEGDEFEIAFGSISPDSLGGVDVTPAGLLLFTPCNDCSGNLTILLRITEIQSAEIEPKTTVETLTIRILSTNDPPTVFSISGNRSILHQDPTEPVIILLEQNHKEENQKYNFTWIFGVYDVDKPEKLTLYIDKPNNGSLVENSAFEIEPTCGMNENMVLCSTMNLPHPPEDMTWLYHRMTYTSDDDVTGYDVIRLYITDNQSLRSDVVTIKMAIMKMPCVNGGACRPKHINGISYPCQDTKRVESFYDYYSCECPDGWSGVNCEEEINECQSSPCDWPYVCYDLINKYQCACPQDEPNCDSLVGWMIALIVIAVVFVMVFWFLLCYCFSLRRGRGKWCNMFGRFSSKPIGMGIENPSFTNTN